MSNICIYLFSDITFIFNFNTSSLHNKITKKITRTFIYIQSFRNCVFNNIIMFNSNEEFKHCILISIPKLSSQKYHSKPCLLVTWPKFI